VENPHKAEGKEHNNNKEDQQPQGHLIPGIPADPQNFPDTGKEPKRKRIQSWKWMNKT
jgi:hypothetical protein